jgi:hypothetical protein
LSVINATGFSIDISVHSLPPFVTLSAGRTTIASFTCTFCDVDFAIYQRLGRPKSRAASGQSASRCSSTNSGTDFGIPPKTRYLNNRVGVFILYKLKVQPFTEKKIELVTTFADRRLLPPRARGCLMSFVSAPQRIHDLSAALEQQTAPPRSRLVGSRFDHRLRFREATRKPSRLWSRIIQIACGRVGFRHTAY